MTRHLVLRVFSRAPSPLFDADAAPLDMAETLHRTVTIELDPERASSMVEQALIDWIRERYHQPAAIMLGVSTFWGLCAAMAGPQRFPPPRLDSFRGMPLFINEGFPWTVWLFASPKRALWDAG